MCRAASSFSLAETNTAERDYMSCSTRFLQLTNLPPAKRSIHVRSGFSLVELLAVIAIISILIGLTLPAVQSVRESARRTECSNNLRQHGLALHNFHSSNHHYPFGAEFETGHSWATNVLPFIELTDLQSKIRFDVPWDHEDNLPNTLISLPIFECPSSIKDYVGKTDYCGISGSSSSGRNVDGSGQNGVLIVAGKPSQTPISNSAITDGLSHTIMVAEGVAVQEENCGYWACGWHCFTHDDGGVNNLLGGFNEIASLHPAGANVLYCDGSLRFISSSDNAQILWGMCTRNGGEIKTDFAN